MKTACIDCQQRLSEVFRNSTENEVPLDDLTAELHQHLAHCPACRAEWAFLKTVRAEMRALPQLDAPQELRARIFQQLTKTPQAAAAPAEQSTWAAPAAALSAWKQRRGRFSSLFKNPFAIAWASGVAVAVFGFITLLRPYSETEVLLPERKDTYTIPKAASEEPRQFIQKNQETKETPPSTSNAEPKAQNEVSKPTLRKTPESSSKPSPKPSRPASTPKLRKPRVSSPPQKRVTPSLKPATPQNKTKQAQPASAESAPKEEKVPLKETEKEKHSIPPSPAFTTERSAEPEIKPEMHAPEESFSAESEAPSQAQAPPTAFMQRRAVPAHREENRMELQANSSLFTQKIQAELLAPENAQRAQITIILPEQVRLKPVGKSAILWQGTLVKEEKLQLNFEVEAVPGRYAIELILQKVQDNSLETIASQTVTFTVHGQSSRTK